MARVRVMYWKEVPVQVQAEDGPDQVSKPLAERFQEGIDAISMTDGSSGTDDYLEGYQWGQYSEVNGPAEQVASKVADRYNRGFPPDFVARVIDMQRSGTRDPQPGAIDHWADDDAV